MPTAGERPRWWIAVLVLAAALLLAALAMAWTAQQRVRVLEQELVARQQQSQSESGEALMLAKQSQDTARESAARMALLEARVAEAAVQRTQFEELIQSLTRTRDESLLAEIESAIRMAQQQAALTGSLEPLIAALRQADERLARNNQPRLERVRRAAARDLERVRSAAQIDVASLVIRLDEVVRQVDDLPLAVNAAARPYPQSPGPAGPVPGSSPGFAPPVAPVPDLASAGEATRPWQQVLDDVTQWGHKVLAVGWGELRSLVRITRIDNPEAVLASPEQQYFLRENLKLRLLHARLALLSRQFEVAHSDLRDAQRSIERYFEPSSRRVSSTVELVRQVGDLTRQVNLPRPDDTLAALAAVNTLR